MSISLEKRGLDSSEYIELIKIFTLALEKHKNYMNSLNVFPVPDADTGTNMYAVSYTHLTLPTIYSV